MRVTRLRTAWHPPCRRLALVCCSALLGFAAGCGAGGSGHDSTRPTAQRVDPELAAALQKALDVERAAASLTGVAAAVVIRAVATTAAGEAEHSH